MLWDVAPDILSTSLDPSESTPQPPQTAKHPHRATWPLTRRSEGSHSGTRQRRVARRTPGGNPDDHPEPHKPIASRAASVSNWNDGIQFRHRTWSGDRSRVKAVLEGELGKCGRYWRFKACGTQAIVYQSPEDPTRYRVGCKRCHDRFCLPCSQDRARLIVANLRNHLGSQPTRFLTLTLKSNDEPLRAQLDRLYASFVLLRRRAWWRHNVTGGVAFCELKVGKGSGKWHPHLHVLLHGQYLPKQLIADSWLQITGDSYVVDIKRAKTPEHVYTYLASYVTKGWSTGVYHDADRLTEAIEAVKGRKLLAAFGCYARINLLKPPNAETWTELGTMSEVLERAREGECWAIVACEAIHAPGFVPALETCPPDE